MGVPVSTPKRINSEENINFEGFSSLDEDKTILFDPQNSDKYFSQDEVDFYKDLYEKEILLQKRNKKRIKWKSGEVIGQGSYGRVVLGIDIKNGQLLAVKQVYKSGFTVNEEKINAMEREIDLLQDLSHRNIVRYLGTEKTKSYLNIFLEYVSGGSIQSLLSKFGKFNETLIKRYLSDILAGLVYLHSHNIVHRDIKGANILVTNKGTCKLTDFGSSKRSSNTFTTNNFSSVIGTTSWMAPEVINQTGHGRFADIWSLGCTVIEMYTGRAPWGYIRNPMEKMSQVYSKKEPPFPDNISDEMKSFFQATLKVKAILRWNAHRLLEHPFVKDMYLKRQEELKKEDVPYKSEIKNKLERVITSNFGNGSKNSDSEEEQVIEKTAKRQKMKPPSLIQNFKDMMIWEDPNEDKFSPTIRTYGTNKF